MNTKTTIGIVSTVAVIGLASFIWLLGSVLGGDTSSTGGNNANVTMQDGVQVISISARGGYSPRKTVAKAGIPTVLNVETNGTFDCSSALYLPSMNVQKALPASGETQVDLGTPQVGVFRGTCSMGMYNFEIDFQG